MENMGTIPARERPSGPTGTAPVTGSNPAIAAPTGAPSAEDKQFGAQIETRYETLQKKREYYAILGISQTASPEQIKNAFLTLAKIFHPDRLPGSMPHLAPKISAVFESIREAFETLYDQTKRAQYNAALAQGKDANAQAAPQRAGPSADDLMKMGEVFFKKRDYLKADEHWARAHQLDKKADSLAARAWAIYMDPNRKPEAQRAKDMMLEALKISNDSDRAHYQLGVIARVEGDLPRSERHFREAVRVNPRHVEANQELRLIDMRKKKAADAKKPGGFFK
jgi:curved DNA-binding protein CbpA